MQHYQQLHDPLGESRANNLLGLIMDETGHYAAAEAYFERALGISRSVGDRLGESMELANLGAIFGERGDYSRERAYYQDALPISQQSGEFIGTSITLTRVSIAPLAGAYPNPARVNFDGKMTLLGYEMNTRTVRPGEAILNWRKSVAPNRY